ncbi:ornithine cyclodeaminase [Meinhardsimonia xiamenensis]|jgi:ornithine cyclodeaminase|uniref:Ornithine cyclodeaminase n=1 Tax=Meinhardsimonia xiamenensis TaxID=990712 RepID=A0A1G9H0H1_9RHOB|nr:ornithine cyclodeaminase [Meinhardsimonia xiamenensis]PRX29741.1 ornithine cyclodeaminase [Meinhardsimonia xiamenensis]SDL06362.1 ornithine cyclodeaminase [Meinhardsimonia xiamenensis]
MTETKPRPAAAPSERALVSFVSVENMMRLVNGIGVEAAITGIAAEIEADFARWEEFDKIPRVASHAPVGVIELMPVSDGRRYAFKYVNGHPKNLREGLQTVVAFGLLADMATGYPLLLTEMTILTALRTAATSALAASRLARPDSRVMALIGNGAQAEFQALAFRTLCGIDTVRLYDIDPEATAKVMRNLAGSGLKLIPCADVAEAVAGADIITTCTADKRNATVLSDNHVGAGVHINAVGGDCPGKTELARDILTRASIFVEFAPQTRIEGEIQQLPADHPVTEFWQVLSGKAPGRRRRDEITLFDSVGFAVEDFAALNWAWREVQASGLAQPLDLLADPDEPRDLYGMLMRAAAT